MICLDEDMFTPPTDRETPPHTHRDIRGIARASTDSKRQHTAVGTDSQTTDNRQPPQPPLGLYINFTRYCFTSNFEALLHNNIFCKHPLYCAIYCTILPVIAPPRPILRCF